MLASNGEITDPCPVPLSLTDTTPSSRTPAFNHFWIRRMMRRSPIRCSRKRISHSWSISSKNDRMSVSSIKLTFLLWIPTHNASRPRQPIHAGCSVLLKLEERLFEQLDADVMEERGEPLLLPFPCHFPYAFQRLFHAYPVLRPARAVLVRISLGPRPWLHRLRCA